MSAFSLFCIIISLLVLAGCAESHRPKVCHGGQYYGDALHAQELNGRGRN
jgi:hypothetical protein